MNDKIIKERLDAIFNEPLINKQADAIRKRGYVTTNYRRARALVVGINPSYLVGDNEHSYFYQLEDALKEYSKHYEPFKKLLTKTEYENDWTYLDLFHFRETNQKNINAFYQSDVQFLIDQLRLTHDIMTAIRPDLLIICNSHSADYFGINKLEVDQRYRNLWYGYDFDFNQKLGVHVVSKRLDESIVAESNSSLVGKPILFTSTLTYKSIFDKMRLNWHIQHIAKNRIS